MSVDGAIGEGRVRDDEVDAYRRERGAPQATGRLDLGVNPVGLDDPFIAQERVLRHVYLNLADAAPAGRGRAF
jgi:hypothetical protein